MTPQIIRQILTIVYSVILLILLHSLPFLIFLRMVLCQDYIQTVIGGGALTLGDTVDGGKVNLYQA